MLLLIHFILRLIAAIDFFVMTLFIYLLSYLPWRGKHPARRLFPTWSRTFVRALGVDLRLHQHQRQALPAQYILVANHPSAFEDIGIPALFPVVSLAKIQVKDWWVVGRISQAGGTLYVDRDDADSRHAAIDTMLAALAAGESIALYPEGGCKGRRLTPEFKSGAFEVAMRSGIPILPVFLHYEAQEDFEWQAPWTLPDKIRHMATSRNRRANFHVFDAIRPQDFADKYALKAAVLAQFIQWDERFLG